MTRATVAAVLATLAFAQTAQAEVLSPSPATVSGFCGFSVATGDVNNDGRDDVVLGCSSQVVGTFNSGGSVQVFVRNAANSGFEGPVELTHPQPANDICGNDVAVGDVNADGKDDVIAGCPGDNAGQSNSGSVVVFRRNAVNTGFETGQVLAPTPVPEDAQCGSAIALAELNGDGRADIVTGCGQNDTAVVFASSAAGTWSANTLTYVDPNIIRCGDSVAIGDLNGDGQPDIAMGCWGSGVRGAVVFMHAAGAAAAFGAGVEVTAGVANELCGETVAIGDLDGNGKGDLAVGCPQADAPGTDPRSSGGVSLLIRNAGNNGFDQPLRFYPPEPEDNSHCGANVLVAEAGGDARKDLLMGCSTDPVDGEAGAGSAVTFRRLNDNSGFATGLVTTHGEPTEEDHCGYGLAVGDVDQNTGGDIVLGCYEDDTGQSGAGSASVFYGSPPSPIVDPEPYVPSDPPPSGGGGSSTTDTTPTSVSASVNTVPAIPLNPDGSITAPTVTCGETTCVVVVDPRIVRGGFIAAKRKPKSIPLGKKKKFTLTKGKKRAAKIKVSKKAKALLKKNGKLKVTFKIKVTDPSNNVRNFTKKATIKPAKKKKRKK